MQRWAAFAIAFVVLLIGGIVHGTLADRWQTSTALTTAVERLPGVPNDVGAWHGKDSEHIPKSDFEQTGALSYLVRIYQRPGHEPIEVILMCGRPGRMSVHTPEICYGGVGYELRNPPKRSETSNGSFWKAQFSKPKTKASDLALYWSWNAGAGWTASDSPRWAFAGQSFLFKLYLSQRRIMNVEGPSETELFLREFLPVLERTLLPGS